MKEIDDWSEKYCEEMKTYPGGPKTWQKAYGTANIQKDQRYVEEHGEMSVLSTCPAHLLNVDNIEFSGMVKNHVTIQYPETKPVTNVGWVDRQVQILDKIYNEYFNSDGTRNSKYPADEIVFWLCWNCAKQYTDANWAQEGLEEAMYHAAKEAGGAELFDNGSMYLLHQWQAHWIP